MPATQPQQSLSSRLAGDLLKAWLSGDAARVAAELARSIAVPLEPDDIVEEERRNLLVAVSERMRRNGNVFRQGDPGLGVCAHLLEHLVCGE